MQDSNWIPVARYAEGFQARPRTKAAGRQVPQPWMTAPAGSPPAVGTVVDGDGVLLAWMAEHRAAALALRPDAYVYAAAPAGAPLAPPPIGFTPAARKTSETALKG